MRPCHAALLALLVVPALATAQENLGTYEDRIAVDKSGAMAAAAMGRSEDHLVKRNGEWLIQSRKLTVFTD